MAIITPGGCASFTPQSWSYDPFWPGAVLTGMVAYLNPFGSGASYFNWSAPVAASWAAGGGTVTATPVGPYDSKYASLDPPVLPDLTLCLSASFNAYGSSSGAEQLQGYKTLAVAAQYRDGAQPSGNCIAVVYGTIDILIANPSVGTTTPGGTRDCAGGGAVTLTWTAATNANLYYVYRDGLLLAGPIVGLTYTDTTADPGEAYAYTVRPYSSIYGWGPMSTVSVSVDACSDGGGGGDPDPVSSCVFTRRPDCSASYGRREACAAPYGRRAACSDDYTRREPI